MNEKLKPAEKFLKEKHPISYAIYKTQGKKPLEQILILLTEYKKINGSGK
jgi:hypothetical protein